MITERASEWAEENIRLPRHVKNIIIHRGATTDHPCSDEQILDDADAVAGDTTNGVDTDEK